MKCEMVSVDVSEKTDFDVDGGVGSPVDETPKAGDGSVLWKDSRSSSIL